MAKEIRDSTVTFRLPGELREDLESLAEDEERSMSSLIVLAIRAYLEHKTRADFYIKLNKRARERGYDSIEEMLDGKSKSRKS